jgi:hypothetical protein
MKRREFLLASAAMAAPPLTGLRVSTTSDSSVTPGRPFFYLADTAWELFHRLDKAQTIEYLDNARQGFTIIRRWRLRNSRVSPSPTLREIYRFRMANPRRPVDAYFRHVDWCSRKPGVEGCSSSAADMGQQGCAGALGEEKRKSFSTAAPPTTTANGSGRDTPSVTQPHLGFLGGRSKPQQPSSPYGAGRWSRGIRSREGYQPPPDDLPSAGKRYFFRRSPPCTANAMAGLST